MKGLEELKAIAIQSVEALIGKQEPLRTQKINELLNTKQFKTIEKELKEKDYIQKALDKIVDHCEIGFGGGKDEDGNWVIYLMFPNQQDITILCKDKEEYDFWVKYADM